MMHNKSISTEGMWTTRHNFLRLFRGMHKHYLSSYVTMYEFAINHKFVAPKFITAIVITYHFFN